MEGNKLGRIMLWVFGSKALVIMLLFMFIPVIIIMAVGAIMQPICGVFKVLSIFGVEDKCKAKSSAVKEINEQLTNTTIGELEIPVRYVPLYYVASSAYSVPAALLAAIHKTETDFGRNMSPAGFEEDAQAGGGTTDTSQDGGGDTDTSQDEEGTKATTLNGVGELGIRMEIWAGEEWKDEADVTDPDKIMAGDGYGIDADDDGKADAKDINDAIMGLANYLSQMEVAEATSDQELREVIYSYKPSEEYVDTVMEYYELLLDDPTIGSMGDGTQISGDWSWPVPYTRNVTSPFGSRNHPITNERKLHQGIDIASPGIEGKPAVAVDDARVTFAGLRGGYGNTVILDVGNGVTILYAHLQTTLVTSGQTVQKGQPIGLVGSTGASTGPHLHFEVKVGGANVNPKPYLTQTGN